MRTSITTFTRSRTTRCPRIGPPAQYIYIYIYYWAYHSYNSPLKFSSLAPQEERWISISLQLPYSYHTSSLSAQVPFQLPNKRFWCFSIRDVPSLNFCSSMFSTFYGAMQIQRLGILLELGPEFSCLFSSLIQILLEHFIHFTFALINIKH